MQGTPQSDPGRGAASSAQGVDTYVRVVGPDHPSVSFALNNLASALAELDRADEALQAARRAHRICSTAMGDDYWITHYIRTNIGWALYRLERHDEAEVELLAAHEGLLERIGPDRRHTRMAADKLVEFYESRGDDAEAARFRSG